MNAITTFFPGEFYTHEEIYRALGVGNAGGIRVSKGPDGSVRRAVLFTSVPTARIVGENPYHDRVEGDTLVYTGAGQEGNQEFGGSNKHLVDHRTRPFPVYGFQLIGSRRDKSIGPRRWQFLGFLHPIRYFKETQIDSRGTSREVCVFELRILASFRSVSPCVDVQLMTQLVAEQEKCMPSVDDDRELEPLPSMAELSTSQLEPIAVERMRSKMLAMPPERFEHLIKDILVFYGFANVNVTRFSQDGGIDVNAVVGPRMWPLRDLLLQVQAKRWLHTVGRKEVAELRGSLQANARGVVVTTSQFSRAAVGEASEAGKLPIVLMDGHGFASIVLQSGALQ